MAPAAKWQKITLPTLADSNTSPQQIAAALAKLHPTIKPLARKGIPSALRPTAWLALSGGLALQAAALPGQYRMLASSTEALADGVVSQIDTDTRTVSLSWRHHQMFKSAKVRGMMHERRAYDSRVCPQEGV